MDSIRHVFTKSRSSSTSSPLIPHDGSSTDSLTKSGKSPPRVDSSPIKRDSGIGRDVLSSLGSPNGRNHSRNPSGASSRSKDQGHSSPNGVDDGVVRDRLEAVLAQTNELDAASVAHLAQSMSENRSKSHGVQGIHSNILASDLSPPESRSSHTSPRQEFVHFSAATLARTKKAKAYYDMRMAGMRIAQTDSKQWNLLQYLRDREVRRQSGEQLDIRLSDGRRDSKGSSISSFGGNNSLGEGHTRSNKRHNIPVTTSQRGHIRQQSSRHHADRFRTSQKGLEYWAITPEEILADLSWQQENPHRMVNRRNELINPPTHEERKSDDVASNTSSLEYDGKAQSRYSSDGIPLSPQASLGLPPTKSPSAKAPIRDIPSFAVSAVPVTPSRSPSPVRGSPKLSRQASDFLDIPQRFRRTLQNKTKGDTSISSSRAPSPGRSETVPNIISSVGETDDFKPSRSSTLPQDLKVNIDTLTNRPIIAYRPRPSVAPQQSETRRDLVRRRARLISTGVTARAMLFKDTNLAPVAQCQCLMGTISGLNRSLATCFNQDHPKAMRSLTTTLYDLESQQTQIAEQVQSALTITRTQTSVSITDIAAEQTSTLLLQVKAIEDKMDALEYRTKSGWTHEKTLHLVFLLLEYIVTVVLWHLWALFSVLRLVRRLVWGVWIVVWGIFTGLVYLVRWLCFIHP